MSVFVLLKKLGICLISEGGLGKLVMHSAVCHPGVVVVQSREDGSSPPPPMSLFKTVPTLIYLQFHHVHESRRLMLIVVRSSIAPSSGTGKLMVL